MQRLREAGLRATTARLAVLQAIEAAADGISAEDVFRQLPERGTRASISTVYRVIHEFERAAIVQRGWDDRGTAFYRLQSPERSAPLQLVCSDCRRSILPADADLHARVLAAVRAAKLDLAGPVVSIHLSIAGCGTPKACSRRSAHPDSDAAGSSTHPHSMATQRPYGNNGKPTDLHRPPARNGLLSLAQPMR